MPRKKKVNGKTNGRARTASARPKRPPRRQALPGMEDHGIQALDEIGERYAEITDQRKELKTEEDQLKKAARNLMHKHGKTSYKHGGIEINIVPGEEDVKVKVRKEEEDEEIAPLPAAEPGADASVEFNQ